MLCYISVFQDSLLFTLQCWISKSFPLYARAYHGDSDILLLIARKSKDPAYISPQNVCRWITLFELGRNFKDSNVSLMTQIHDHCTFIIIPCLFPFSKLWDKLKNILKLNKTKSKQNAKYFLPKLNIFFTLKPIKHCEICRKLCSAWFWFIICMVNYTNSHISIYLSTYLSSFISIYTLFSVYEK